MSEFSFNVRKQDSDIPLLVEFCRVRYPEVSMWIGRKERGVSVGRAKLLHVSIRQSGPDL